MKNYVYSHPVNVFIIGVLGMSVEVFCEQYNFKSGTLSSWVTRNRAVADLPVSFVYSLSLASSSTMDQVYSKLLLFEEEHHNFMKKNMPKKKKKYIE